MRPLVVAFLVLLLVSSSSASSPSNSSSSSSTSSSYNDVWASVPPSIRALLTPSPTLSLNVSLALDESKLPASNPKNMSSVRARKLAELSVFRKRLSQVRAELHRLQGVRMRKDVELQKHFEAMTAAEDNYHLHYIKHQRAIRGRTLDEHVEAPDSQKELHRLAKELLVASESHLHATHHWMKALPMFVEQELNLERYMQRLKRVIAILEVEYAKLPIKTVHDKEKAQAQQ